MGVKLAQSLVIFQKLQIYLTKIGVARACSRSEKNNFLPSLFTRKRTKNNLKIIDLFLHSQSLVKYLKNLFIKDFITFL